ncbi:MAG: acyl-CoA synthetase [Actinobacteria bacterium]|nr:acyl-CoA synthetase [Actinomycetota bacterium]
MIMVEKKLRPIMPIQAEWSTPQLQENIAVALEGSGAALSTTKLKIKEVDEDVALVVNSSGSTGEAKLVVISRAALIASTNASHKFLGAVPGDTWSLLLPTTHIAGLNVIIRATALGTKVIDNRGVNKYEDADFISIVPTQLHKAIYQDRKLLEHLTAAEAVLVGGGPLDSNLKKLAESKHVKIVTTYGMTEMSGGCVYNNKPLEGVKFGIDKNGLIKLAGPMLAKGYLGEGGTINAFDDSGWFTTTDLGQVSSGLLKVIGRADEVIITGGEKISLPFVEDQIKSIFPNTPLIVFSIPDKIWGERLCIGSITNISLEEIGNKLGPILKPKTLFLFNEIPTTAIGKPDRQTAKKMALEIGLND